MERKLRLGTNIAILRHFYGESQEELAHHISDVSDSDSGHSLIANYEQGTRTPSEKIIEIIARHYNVTVDSLMYTSFNDDDFLALGGNILRNAEHIDEALFPFENVNMENDSEYMEGLEKHRKIINETYQDESRLYEDYGQAMDAYLSSFEKHSNMSSIVNSLSLVISTYNRLSSIGEDDYVGKIPENGEWTRKIAQLANPFMVGDSTKKQNIQSKKDYFAVTIHSTCFTLMRILKKESIQYEYYADYYWALLYFLNLDNHSGQPAERTNIGVHMLMDLCELKNPYAEKMLDFFYPKWNK